MTKKSKNSKFLGPGPIQASQIMLPIDFPPRETYRVLEFWRFTAKRLAFSMNKAFFYEKMAKIVIFSLFWALDPTNAKNRRPHMKVIYHLKASTESNILEPWEHSCDVSIKFYGSKM